MNTLSAGGVIINSKGQVAVVSQHGRSWSLPKGHVESSEDLLSAARREILEETGLKDLTLLGDLGSYSRYKIAKGGGDDLSEFKTMHFFAFSTLEMQFSGTDPDNPEALWMHPNAVVDLLTHPKDKSFYLGVLDRALGLACRTVTTTFADLEHAKTFASDLVESQLGSCVQITGPVLSTYFWEGKLCQSQEWRVEIKTSVFRLEALKVWISKMHLYQLPELVISPIMGGSVDYLQWLM